MLVAHGDFLRFLTRGATEFSHYPWKNAECKVFVFDPEWVDGEECYLREEKAIVATGGYAPTSTEADLWPAAV